MSLPALKPQPFPVLLIEDEPAVMAYVQAALERSGYPVVCCESGVDALRLLETGSFLGVVSDMRTPGGVDGGHVHAWIVRNRPDLAETVRRMKAFADAGADCLYAPGTKTPEEIAALGALGKPVKRRVLYSAHEGFG